MNEFGQLLICGQNVSFFVLLSLKCFVFFDFFIFLYFQDWLDIDFGIVEGVDFIVILFVKFVEVIKYLKSYIVVRFRDRYIL